ncbi:ATP-dependent RNA helicase tdrd9 [Perkinsus olseni]|uniref:ATP-dependent RNA helicase tdrd9 n=3 Tax=Perkinsus olseni TaxID=32597 RepID=A0A7J6NNV4_PEROL|nr:ATP-dependent RNA helicase tdrd9 [Perkinsus olseni]
MLSRVAEIDERQLDDDWSDDDEDGVSVESDTSSSDAESIAIEEEEEVEREYAAGESEERVEGDYVDPDLADDGADDDDDDDDEDFAYFDEDEDDDDDDSNMRKLRQMAGADGKVRFPEGECTALPVFRVGEKVCKRVRRHRVACIEGDTGSGKTTMIPLLLLAEDDQDVGPNRGTEAGRRLAKIVCTQPRRIAAIQVARRVAGFCNPNTLGQVTGYRVSGQSNVSEDTQIEYVTTGYLLQVLIHRPDDVHLYTHIVLDEVHERTLDSDFLSLICKRLLLRPENGDTKLVIMSATLNSDLFSQYFTDLNNGTAPKAITIQGQRFPVDDVYLNDLINDEELGKGAKKAKEEFDKLTQKIQSGRDDYGFATGGVNPEQPPWDDDINRRAELYKPTQDLLVQMLLTRAKRGSTTLVFVPGKGEIDSIMEDLEKACKGATPESQNTFVNYDETLESLRLPFGTVYIRVFPLHSKLTKDEQDLATKQPMHDERKIVLATNIAESSLTVLNVDLVIDTGLRRENIFDHERQVYKLTHTWCSKASVRQRAGRTGRVCAGTAIRLFTKEFHDEYMDEYDRPEILFTDLTTLFLQAKYVTEFCKEAALPSYLFDSKHQQMLDVQEKNKTAAGSCKPSELLQALITPPRQENVRAAVVDLFHAGILLEKPDELSPLSLLGTLATRLHIDAHVTRIVYYSWLMGIPGRGSFWRQLRSRTATSSGSPHGTSRDMKTVIAVTWRALFWWRIGFDDGAFSEPIMLRRLLVRYIEVGIAAGLEAGCGGSTAERLFNNKLREQSWYPAAVNLQAFNGLVNSASKICHDFCSWLCDDIGDKVTLASLEKLDGHLRGNLTVLDTATFQQMLAREVDEAKSLLCMGCNSRVITGEYSQHLDPKVEECGDLVKFERLPQQLVMRQEDAYATSRQNTPMHQLVLKLTGKAPAGGNADYNASDHSFEFQPAEDNRSVDKNVMVRDSEFQFIAPVTVRLLQAFYDGRYQCTVKPDRATWADWVKLKRPLIPNVIRWRKYYSDTPDMISASRINSQFHVQVSPRNPPGWLGSKPNVSSPSSGTGPVDRRPRDIVEGPELYWGIVGKIQASSSHRDNRRINDARADGVTVLPCRCRNRVAMVMLMAFLPFRHGLAAKVDGAWRVTHLRLAGDAWRVVHPMGPITGEMLARVAKVRDLMAASVLLRGRDSTKRRADASVVVKSVTDEEDLEAENVELLQEVRAVQAQLRAAVRDMISLASSPTPARPRVTGREKELWLVDPSPANIARRMEPDLKKCRLLTQALPAGEGDDRGVGTSLIDFSNIDDIAPAPSNPWKNDEPADVPASSATTTATTAKATTTTTTTTNRAPAVPGPVAAEMPCANAGITAAPSLPPLGNDAERASDKSVEATKSTVEARALPPDATDGAVENPSAPEVVGIQTTDTPSTEDTATPARASTECPDDRAEVAGTIGANEVAPDSPIYPVDEIELPPAAEKAQEVSAADSEDVPVVSAASEPPVSKESPRAVPASGPSVAVVTPSASRPRNDSTADSDFESCISEAEIKDSEALLCGAGIFVVFTGHHTSGVSATSQTIPAGGEGRFASGTRGAE